MDAPLAIVDLETTGSDPATDRITEIALLEVDGFALTAQWSTLVNPGSFIPGPIQSLTGITQEMVERAPRFARHRGRAVRAARRARVRRAQRALRLRIPAARVRARRPEVPGAGRCAPCGFRAGSIPARHGHDLDSLIARHGLECEARHRAAPDAAAVWQFLRVAADEHGLDVLEVAARQVSRQPTLPPQLERGAIDAVPEAPGVYLFYDDGAAPLYIGKSRSMRSRVLQHFIATSSWTPRVRRIEWQRTAGELGALLREAALVKELDPVYNRQLRRPGQLCGFAFDGRRLRLARARGNRCRDAAFRLWPVALAPRCACRRCVRPPTNTGCACRHWDLSQARQGACLRHQIGRCAGVCAGKENIHVHHARVATALARLKSADWPHRGPLGVVEHDAGRDATEVHVARPLVLPRHCALRQRSRRAARSAAARASTTTITGSSRATSASAACASCRSPPDALRAARPGLFAAKTDGRFSGLELLLARGRRVGKAEPKSLEPWLQRRLRARATRRSPPARSPSLASGGDPGERWWPRADPVHLRVMRDHVMSSPAEALTLSQKRRPMRCAATPLSALTSAGRASTLVRSARRAAERWSRTTCLRDRRRTRTTRCSTRRRCCCTRIR